MRKKTAMSQSDEFDAALAPDAREPEHRQAVPHPPQHKMNLGRRRFLFAGAAAGIGSAAAAALHDGALGGPTQAFRGAVPWAEGTADVPPGALGTGYGYFTPAEVAFIEAAVERLIPSDPIGPGAVAAGVPFFLDRQLAGKFGQGDHFYLVGPWAKGTPEQGYQGRFTPAQLYRAAMAAIDRYVGAHFTGATFTTLASGDQDSLLKGLESGAIQLDGGVDGKTFFAMLLQNTKEGYFSDPIYGGNKDMAAWKMIGFPGAHYDYKEWVSRHGERVPFLQVGFKGRPGWT
jgi:gluconate 2-dehydrogenase gamma chain